MKPQVLTLQKQKSGGRNPRRTALFLGASELAVSRGYHHGLMMNCTGRLHQNGLFFSAWRIKEQGFHESRYRKGRKYLKGPFESSKSRTAIVVLRRREVNSLKLTIWRYFEKFSSGASWEMKNIELWKGVSFSM